MKKKTTGPKTHPSGNVPDIGQRSYEKWLEAPNARREIPKGLLLEELRAAASNLTPEMVAMLALPERFFMREGRGFKSFSSEKDRGIEDFSAALLSRDELPDPSMVADFGIDLRSRGGGTFCVLFDRKRKLIVYDEIRSMQGGDGSWAYFMNLLEESIAYAKKIEGRGEPFSFIINGAVLS